MTAGIYLRASAGHSDPLALRLQCPGSPPNSAPSTHTGTSPGPTEVTAGKATHSGDFDNAFDGTSSVILSGALATV